MTLYIAVIGPADASEKEASIAEEVGALLAKAGCVVVTGGLGGVMEAAARGAKSEGGTTLGILPGDSRHGSNPFVDLAVPTGMGEARNALIARAADGVIAVGGGYGTLSEIALALKMGKPVVGIGTWEVSEEIKKAADGAEAVEYLMTIGSH